MRTHKVVLTNSSIGITVSTVAVCGHSGKRYGHSIYSDKYRCHTIEMTPEEYETAADDLSRGWHKALCKWVPHFVQGAASNVVTPENNEALRLICMESARKLSSEDITAIAREHGLIITAVPIEVPPAGAPVVQVLNVHSDPPMAAIATRFITNAAASAVASGELPTKYLSLCKMARDEGIDISALPRKGEAVRAAILTHRQQKAA